MPENTGRPPDVPRSPSPERADEPVNERIYSGIGYKVEFQFGPVKEHGRNGAQVEDLIKVAISRVNYLNEKHEGGKFRCRENSLAVTKLEEALLWLRARTALREEQGVEGKNLVHQS